MTATAITAVTATTTSVVVQYTNFCNPTNNYGLSYNGGYASYTSSQNSVGVIAVTPSTYGTTGGCCSACYNAPGCYLFYIDRSSNDACNLLLTDSYTPGTGFYGLGACSNFAGLSDI